MSLITLTANNVLPSSNCRRVVNDNSTPTRAYEAFTAGKLAYKHADGRYGLASATGSGVVTQPVGMFENSGGTDQVCSIIASDPDLTITGAVFTTLGKVLLMGATAGSIVEHGDQATGWYINPVAVVKGTNTLDFNIAFSSVGPIA